MDKPWKIIISFFVILILVIAGLYGYYLYKQNSNNKICNPTAYKIAASGNLSLPSGIVFYYGSTCPHCKLVEEFMKNNSIESKISIIQKEVFQNKTNADEMVNIQNLCKLPQEDIGAVPLLYLNNTCYLGDKDIICILKSLGGL